MYGRRPSLLVSNTVRGASYHAKTSSKRLSPRPQKSNPDFLRAANNLVKKAADQPAGWKHTPSLRGEEKRLESKIKTIKKAPRPPSAEKLAFTTAEREPSYSSSAGEEEVSSDKTFEIGSFVEVRKFDAKADAVLLAQLYVDRKLNLISLLSTGEVWEHSKDDVAFDIPNFLPTDLAERCGYEELPSNQNQLKARVEVLRQLSKFQKEIEDARKGISSLQLDVYSIAKSSDPHQWGSITVKEVAHLMTKNPTVVTYLAAHKHLMAQAKFFRTDHDYIFSQRFTARPQAKVDRLNTITEWCAMKDGPITAFREKAVEIRKAHRLLLDKHYKDTPTRRPGSHSWNDKDKIILQFLLDSLRPRPMTQPDVYILGTSFICKQVMEEKDRVDDSSVHQLLIELGVIAPWQDITDFREELDIDIDGIKMEKLNKVVSKKLSAPSISGSLGPEDFYPSDPSEAFRYDFGDIPVYVVDEPTASELDDGVSVETIPSEPDAYWLHVHVADPASCIPPSHIFAKYAYHRGETVYLYHFTDHMLPPSLTHHSEHGLSLGAVRSGTPRRVMTFSAKINSKGDILDYKVRPGLVKNLIVTTYESVNHALGLPATAMNLPFGDIPDPQPLKSHSDFNISQLRILKTIRDWMVERRYRDGVFNHNHVDFDLFDIKFPSFLARPTMEPTLFTGFPAAKYQATPMSDMDVGARSVVSECMKIAGRVGSLYSTEHDIPVLRRYATRPVAVSDSDFQAILDNRTPNGYVGYTITSSRLISESVAGYSTNPKEHYGNGITERDGYVRMTSPLRRYTDLMSHWQLHASIQGKSFPFSNEWLKDFCATQKAKERLSRRAVGLHKTHWSIMYIQRWMKEWDEGFHRDKPNPLHNLVARTSTLPMISNDTKKFVSEGTMETLGVKTVIVGVNQDTPPGTILPVELTGLRLGARPQVQVTVKG